MATSNFNPTVTYFTREVRVNITRTYNGAILKNMILRSITNYGSFKIYHCVNDNNTKLQGCGGWILGYAGYYTVSKKDTSYIVKLAK